jgi:hypothetical protein
MKKKKSISGLLNVSLLPGAVRVPSPSPRTAVASSTVTSMTMVLMPCGCASWG